MPSSDVNSGVKSVLWERSIIAATLEFLTGTTQSQQTLLHQRQTYFKILSSVF